MGDGPRTTSADETLKFAACAVIDLQGFSSHLEISGYDLRTRVGAQAIERLQVLEDAIARVRREQRSYPDYYPAGLRIQRMNDAIVLVVDLDDILLPSVGQTVFRGLPASELERHFRLEELSEEGFSSAYEARIQRTIEPLQQFVGLVARVTVFINELEGSRQYPGVKAVVASGFRKPFVVDGIDDVFSANFAFANAYLAERDLRGPNFYLDNHLIELLARNTFAAHLVQFGHFGWRVGAFDALADRAGDSGPPKKAVVLPSVETSLFRRKYLFQALSPAPLTYLQQLPNLKPFLVEDREPNRSNRFYAHVFDAAKHGMGKTRLAAKAPPRSFVYSATNDLYREVRVFEEFLTSGESEILEKKRKAKRNADAGVPDLDPDSELARKLDALDGETVAIEIPDGDLMTIEDLGDVVWELREEGLTPLLGLMVGGLSLLEFPVEQS